MKTLKPNRILIAALCLAGAAAPAVRAQHQHPADAGNAKATLIAGAGQLNHPVSTKNAEAQKFFNQGLALIYGFNHEEARRSFEHAARLDPKLAMAHWGIALAIGPNYNESQIDPARQAAAEQAMETARQLAAEASAPERAYIEALARRFQPKVDPKNRAVEYKDAMGALHRQNPDDLDAAVLYADSLMNLTPWQLWTKGGEPGEYTLEVVSILESVLKRDPNHLGGNHLYIHAVEASKAPGRALPSADRLGRLAPDSGHLVHMPAHIYLRTGDYSSAAAVNEKAAQVDLAYIKRTGVRGLYPAMYYSHNLHFLVESYNRSGQSQLADRSAQRLVENVRQHLKEMPMLESFLPSVMFVKLRFNRWDEIMKLPEPNQEMPVARGIWYFSRGVALCAQQQTAAAKEQRNALAQSAETISGETPFGLNSAKGILKVARRVLDARLAAAEGDRRTAINFWREAVAAQDELNYDEPPGWYYPIRESLGAALLMEGEVTEAEQVFRRDLEQNPRNGRSLFGLAECLKRLNKTSEARAAQREFESAWKNADTKLRIEDL